jgi:hypothetical protein
MSKETKDEARILTWNRQGSLVVRAIGRQQNHPGCNNQNLRRGSQTPSSSHHLHRPDSKNANRPGFGQQRSASYDLLAT